MFGWTLDGIWPSSGVFFHIHEAYKSFACYIKVSECKRLLTNASLTFNCPEFIKRVVVLIWPQLSGMSKGVLFLYVHWEYLENGPCLPYIYFYILFERSPKLQPCINIFRLSVVLFILLYVWLVLSVCWAKFTFSSFNQLSCMSSWSLIFNFCPVHCLLFCLSYIPAIYIWFIM